jgi:hypothetical protein
MKRFFLSCLLVTALAAGGCSSESDKLPPGQAPAATTVFSTQSSETDFTISPATLAVLLPDASETQKETLGDGRLSLAEYEAAKLAEVACLREAGLTVPETIELDGLFRYRYTVYSENNQESDGAIGRCAREHAGVIDMVWAEVSVPLYQETIVESRRLMKECYDKSGLKVRDEPHRSTDPEIIASYHNCRSGVDALLRLGGVFWGVEGDGRPGYR